MIEQQNLTDLLQSGDAPAAPVAEPLQDALSIEDPFPAPDFSEGEQVAGLGSIGAAISSRVAKSTAVKAKTAADAAAREAAMPEAAKAITPQVADNIAADAKAAQAAGKVLAKPPEDLLNYLRTGLPDDANHFLDQTAKAAGVRTPDVVSYKDEINKLSAMGFKSSDIEWIANYANNTDQMKRVAQSRELLVSATKQAQDLANRVIANPTDPKLAAEYHQATQFLGVITRGVKNMQTDYARALGIMRMNPVGDTAALTDLVDSIGGIENVVAHAKKLAKEDLSIQSNIAKVAKLSEASMWSKVKNVWTTTWINGMLSSPVTHSKNIVGNGLFAAMQIPERAVAAGIGKVTNRARAFRNMDMREVVAGEEAMALIEGAMNGAMDSLAVGAKAFMENKPQFGAAGKIEQALPDAISGDAFGLSGYMAKGMDLYGKFVTIPGRALMAEDEVFKTLNYSMELHAQAARRKAAAYRQTIASGGTTADAENAARSAYQSVLDAPPAEIDAAAMNAARVNTFTNSFEHGSSAQMLSQFANSNLVAKMFLPFVKTPLNIASQTLQRSPFAPMSKMWREDIAAGGIRKDMALAKMAFGTTVLAGIGMPLAAGGFITGRGPGNQGVEENLRRSGWQPYSFVIPDLGAEDIKMLQNKFGRENVVVGSGKTYVSFQGIEPIGGMLAMAADYSEYARWQDNVDLVEEVAMGAALGLGNYATTLPYVQAVGEFAQLWKMGGDGPQLAKNIVAWAEKQVGGYVIGGSPMGVHSSLQGTVERMIDPTLSATRQVGESWMTKGFYEAFDRYRSRVPGLSDDLPPKLDRWARPIKSGQGNWYEVMSPTKISPANATKADEVLLENRVPLTMKGFDQIGWKGEGPYKGLSVKLDDSQRNELITIYAKEIKAGGMDVQQAIVAYAKDKAFDRLTLGEKQKVLLHLNGKYMEAAADKFFKRHYRELTNQFADKKNIVDTFGYYSDELKD